MKKIAVFLVFVLMFTLSSCGSVKEKVAEKVEEKIEEKVDEELAKVEKEVKKAEEELNESKESADENVKEESGKKENKDKKKAGDKKDKKDKDSNFKEEAANSEELALEIFESAKGDLIYDISAVFAGDFDNDGENDEAVVITSYTSDYDVSLCSSAYLIDLFNKKIVDEISVDNYAATEPEIVRFQDGEESFLYFLVENGANLQGLLLYSIYEKGFDLSMMGVPSMPPAYINLIDENADGVYEVVHEDLMNEEVFYLPTTIINKYAQGDFYIDYASVDLGDYPDTPAAVVEQYLYALHLRDIRFTNAYKVYGLDERLFELVTADALTTEIYFANDLLMNTAMGLEPKLVFEEKIYDESSAGVYITVQGDYVDEASGRTSENFGFGMGLVKEDGKWKISGGYSLY